VTIGHRNCQKRSIDGCPAGRSTIRAGSGKRRTGRARFRCCGKPGFVQGTGFSPYVTTVESMRLHYKAAYDVAIFRHSRKLCFLGCQKSRAPHPSRCWQRVRWRCSSPRDPSPQLLLIPPFAKSAKDGPPDHWGQGKKDSPLPFALLGFHHLG
jgi:hypothetical protein